MATHAQMKALADNDAAVNALASFLLSIPEAGWTDWERDFLDHMATRHGPEPISTRQREVLIELRDGAKRYDKVDGMSVAGLIERCWQARLDLDEEEESFVVDLYRQRYTSLNRRPLLRLLRCARQLELLDDFVPLD